MEFKSLSARQLKMFSLPQKKSFHHFVNRKYFFEEKSIVEDAVTVINNEPFKPSCLACSILSFDTFEQQRAHYKLEWHRFNVKRRAINIDAGRTHYIPISEQNLKNS
ncbi:11919_t:CDS:1 [Gigaspora margarita]|uniref:11919_t:CDS:1 n=1 Tax=Gigaspora margarita TaxID=4874 RepID=A0ABN7URA3_GIGMA|nr:11919_t:CDS:1 [Gigaspora margarita]